MCKYNGIVIILFVLFYFQYKSKATIILPLVGVLNIMKNNQYQIHLWNVWI
jgi:hypothetical protein